MKRIVVLGMLAIFISINVASRTHMFTNLDCVNAQTTDVKYLYDEVGRLIEVTYPNGKQLHYNYDENGNLVEHWITEGSTAQGNTSGNNTVGDNDTKLDSRGTGYLKLDLLSLNDGSASKIHDTFQDRLVYEKFKKKAPVIKSLNVKKNKKRHYIQIQVRKLYGLGNYQELGYEVRYAANKKLKRAKTLCFDKKGSVTGKKWKVKKGKQYWVKVRAYMKTKTGKTIYSKYSKVKNVRID